VVDLGPLLCPGGRFARQIDGVPAPEDGITSRPGSRRSCGVYIEARMWPWPAEATATPGG
jgi:hypothetical protein